MLVGIPRGDAKRLAVIAALVFVGCYLGATVSSWITFPGVGAAVLYVPYAIVLGALWRTPPRAWWLVLLAASAATFLPHRLNDKSVEFVLCAELVNHARAVLAVVVFRWASRSAKLETIQAVLAYLVAVVIVAPAVAGLGGATLVTTLGSSTEFGIAWKEWTLSNTIAGLTLAPILVAGAPGIRITRAVRLECTALFASFIGAGLYVFAVAYQDSPMHQAHLYWALPFLLWAGIRFGLRGASMMILAVAIVSTWGAMEGRGPFASLWPEENLLELQVFLLGVSIPVLLLAVMTEQHRVTAAALSESRRHYQSIVEDQTEMICRFGRDGTRTFANRAYRETFPAGMDQSNFDLSAITLASPIVTHEISAETRDGLRWQLWSVRGLFDDNGALVEFQAVGRDVTDRKRAEDEHRELESRKSVEAALREAERRKDEFLAILGTELHSPLAPIGIALEILINAKAGSEDVQWARESIQRQLGHLTRVVDELLEVSRVTLGKIELLDETVDLRRIIANAVEVTRGFIAGANHNLALDIPDRPILVRGDSMRLTQVVANLLDNAAKYTERGGRITITVATTVQTARISVRDTGIGIAPESLGNIFDLFMQVPEARERSLGGLGVGLTLVKKLVELHDGTIEARSDGLARGSVFVVELPITECVEDEPLPVFVGEAVPSRPLRILAVDDNVDIADGLAAVLALWGHTVQTAYDGATALEVVAKFDPEVVFVDLALPRVSGLDVARRMREMRKHATAMLVSMTGYGEDDLRMRSTEAGFHHHLIKPLDLDSLRALLENTKK